MTIRMIRGLFRIRSGSDPILIRIVFFDPFGSADYEFTIRSGSDPQIRIGSDILRNPNRTSLQNLHFVSFSKPPTNAQHELQSDLDITNR